MFAHIWLYAGWRIQRNCFLDLMKTCHQLCRAMYGICGCLGVHGLDISDFFYKRVYYKNTITS